MFESRFLRGSDLEGRPWTLTIADVRLEELRSRYHPPRTKGILTFEGAKREFILNRTNSECLKRMFGRETDAWVGRRVTLHAVPYEGELAIRVLGSPDLDRDLEVEIAMPSKRPFTMRLQRTSPHDAERRERHQDEQGERAHERHERFGRPPSDELSQHAARPLIRAGGAARSTPRLRPVPQPQPPTTRPGRR